MADDPKKPYGDVEYADEGVRPDGKKRYPCDTEKHARAAWAYVNVPENAAKYTDEQLAAIKTKIRAALKRYGVEVEASAEPPAPDEPPPDEPQTPETEAPAESGASSCPAPAGTAAVHAAASETTAPAAEDKTEQKGAGLMDPAKIREALGLAPDVSDDEVKAALVTAGLATAPPDHSDQKLSANAAKAGLVTIDPSQLQQLQDNVVRAAALAKKLEMQDRDAAIEKAVVSGKFPPARREHYERLWDADPEGTKALIASLATGLIPVTAMGYSNDVDVLANDELDREIARLTQPLSSPKGA